MKICDWKPKQANARCIVQAGELHPGKGMDDAINIPSHTAHHSRIPRFLSNLDRHEEYSYMHWSYKPSYISKIRVSYPCFCVAFCARFSTIITFIYHHDRSSAESSSRAASSLSFCFISRILYNDCCSSVLRRRLTCSPNQSSSAPMSLWPKTAQKSGVS